MNSPLIVCQGFPIAVVGALESAGDAAPFFMRITLGQGYTSNSATHIQIKRFGVVAGERHIPVRRIPSRGLLRLLMLPIFHTSMIISIVRELRRWPEAKGAVFIGRTWLACIIGLASRCLGQSRSVVYWLLDHFPIRGPLEFKIINVVFVFINRLCLLAANEAWYATPRIYEAQRTLGFRPTFRRERIVPIPFDIYFTDQELFSEVNLHHFVYAGQVQRGQGLEIVLPAIAALHSEWPDLVLNVAGPGPDGELFREMARSLGVSEHIVFHGYINEADLIALVSRSAAGFALYGEGGHGYYAITGKAFLYAGCGVPTIIDRGAGSFDRFIAAGAGIESSYSTEGVIAAMRSSSSRFSDNTCLRTLTRKFAYTFPADGDKLKTHVLQLLESQPA